MNYPTISVIIPTWNSGHTLKATIESCLNQTHPPLEIFVCDDGSTDNSREVVMSIGDERVKWIDGAHNSGTPAVPRNRGLARAQGEWLAFCDSDDTWLPEKLTKQLETAEKRQCDAVSSNALRKIDGTITNSNIVNWTKGTISFNDLLKTNTIICSSVLLHNSIIKVVGGFPEGPAYKGFEDYAYWLKVLTKTKFAFVSESLVIYDDHVSTSMRGRAGLSGETIQKRAFSDFTNWARQHALYFFIIQIRVCSLKLWAKKVLRAIIKY